MRPVIIAANWKMHSTPSDAAALATTIAARTSVAGVERVICPPFVCLATVRDALASEAGVEAVHHLHVWTTGSEQSALSAHVVLGGPLSLHDAQLRAGELKRMLAEQFGIEHATLEVECHACIEDEAHEHAHG